MTTTYSEFDDREGKVKKGKPIMPFPLGPSLFLNKPKAERWKNMHVLKRKIKTAELASYSASTVLKQTIHTELQNITV